MKDFMIFILATAGLVWILNKSKLFKSWREYLSRKNKEKLEKNYLWWFLDSIHLCSGCMGFWAGIIVYVIQKNKVDFLLYMLLAAISSVFIISLWQKIERP